MPNVYSGQSRPPYLQYFDVLVEDDSQMFKSERNYKDIVVPPDIYHGDLPRESFDIEIIENDKESFARAEVIWNKLHENSENTLKFIHEKFSELLCFNIPFILEFFEYHLIRYYQKHGNTRPFLYFLQEILPDFQSISDPRRKTIIDWIDAKKNEIKNEVQQVQPLKKIKFNGTPSQFGYIFLELIKHGHVEPPLHNGEPNYAAFARLCFDYFDISTTLGNLTKELNPSSNKLSDTKRAKFSIPDLSDLA
jgi:hypothetical protein